jgi:hypothetical protein
MTGLDLESFLLLLRADLTTWAALALATLGLSLLVWLGWRSRRALRKCLVLSLAAHVGLVFYGSTIPAVMWTLGPDRRDAMNRSHIREIRVAPLVESRSSGAPPQSSDPSQIGANAERWDPIAEPLKLANDSLKVDRPKTDNALSSFLDSSDKAVAPTPAVNATPKGKDRPPIASPAEPRPESVAIDTGSPPTQPAALPPSLMELEQTVPQATNSNASSRPAGAKPSHDSSPNPDPALTSDRRLRPDRIVPKEPSQSGLQFSMASTPGPKDANAAANNAKTENVASQAGTSVSAAKDTIVGMGDPIPLARATPKPRSALSGGSGLAAISERAGGQNLIEIPKIYQPRLEPNRSTRAQRIGATAASELAVERALDWLARHQDDDGRWDGGVARYDDGTAVKGDHDYTMHCPPGATCSGACAYWEADTALTGLALLTYLGAGYTQSDGRYAEAIGKALEYLIEQQKPDGDLRGRSQVVGMYCHAMATLALCEAYALTSDDRLRRPAGRAVAFLANSRARDGMAWRYAPGAPAGDTSILGWVVMGLKSAKEVGIAIPNETSIRRGTLRWLEQVATGQSQGLARYQPWEPVTPTMTAEAWVCRQFLGVGGPGAASSEAAEFLLQNESDRGSSNVYYWYYATLALYQHGGEPWARWNSMIRDRIVALQSTSGHQTGSWEPDNSVYGAKGGRIYCTTLAALSLEVYYRYLRLYDEPKIPLEANAKPDARLTNPTRSRAASTTNVENR